MSVWKAVGWFAGGVLTGSAGFKALGSKDAKSVYKHAVAAALRCKESTMETATKIKENADDIITDAKKINEERIEREMAEEVIEDTSEAADAAENEAADAADAAENEAAGTVDAAAL